jgi:hypothetical protein
MKKLWIIHEWQRKKNILRHFILLTSSIYSFHIRTNFLLKCFRRVPFERKQITSYFTQCVFVPYHNADVIWFNACVSYYLTWFLWKWVSIYVSCFKFQIALSLSISICGRFYRVIFVCTENLITNLSES